MAVVGVRISGINSGNLNAAVAFIQANLIMLPDDIIRALSIKDFIFYSGKFRAISLIGYPFTITTVSFASSTYINISGGVLEIPIYQSNSYTLYQRLNADEYYPKYLINSNDVERMLDLYVSQHSLKLLTEVGGDFNDDFNADFYL